MTKIYKAYGIISILMLSMCGTLSAQEVLFTDDFESGSFRPEWTFGAGQPNGVIEVTPTESLEGAYAARLGKSSDDEYALNRLDLPLDLSLPGQMILELMVGHSYEETQVQDGIFLSTDGGASFTKIYGFAYENWAVRKSGFLPPINISALARKEGLALSRNSVIRFQQYGKDDFNGSADFSDGIYIDKVTVLAVDIPHAKLPFIEDFSAGNLQLPMITGDPALSDSSDVLSNAFVLDVVAFEADSSRGNVLRMGSKFDKSPATSAADIYLDLAGEKNVKLSFDFYDNRDETSPADGIFFSDNGGYSFKKVMSFDTDNWADDVFGTMPLLNVDRLARLHGLNLNERFVIRFQQHGSNDFEGSRLSSDGIMIDNVRVFTVETSYAQLPFTENFDVPKLASYWQSGAPYYPDMAVSISPYGIVEPVTMEDGRTAVRLGNTVDRCYTTNALDLYIEMAGHPDAMLSFTYIDNYDETHEQDGIFFSNDGGDTFEKVFDFDGEEWTDKIEGSFNSLSIAQLAQAKNISLTDSFVIRFQQHDNDDFIGTRTISDGIYLDDIRIEEPQPEYLSVPFREDFESDTLKAYWSFGNPMLTAQVQNIKPGGVVAILDSVGINQSGGLALGRTSDGKPTTNALDLHLALAGEKNLELKFWLHNNYNELGEEDGIWLSRDGGHTFKKAYSYPSALGSKKLCSINLDSLAAASGVRYSDQFVVRFQQSDDRRFDGRGNMKGGLYLDNVVVTNILNTPLVALPSDSTLLTDCQEYPLNWQEVINSTSYRAQLFVMDGEKEMVVKDTSLTSNKVLFTELAEDSTYYCRVQALGNFTAGEWSNPVMFRTYRMFEASLQISGVVQDENTVVLQASKLPAHEYQWYRNGEKLDSTNKPNLSVQEPGEYSVFITNESCGVMSPALEVNAKALGLKEGEDTKKAASRGFGNR